MGDMLIDYYNVWDEYKLKGFGLTANALKADVRNTAKEHL